jgi:hypothetical protein
LRVFGCACYPNLSTQAPHKLAPRSTRCVILGYSADHKGYRCLDLSTNNIIVFRHVIFDESDFPFAASPCLTNDLDIFLQYDSLGAIPMPAPLPVPHVPWGSCHWPRLAVRPLAQAVRPLREQRRAVRPRAQVVRLRPEQELAVRPLLEQGLAVQPPDPASRATPSTSAAPHAMSTNPATPPMAPVSQLYPLHYSRRPQAVQELPTLPLHQQPPLAKAVPVAPLVNPYPMTTWAKRGFWIPADKLSLSATSSSTLSPVPTSIRAALTDPSWRRAMEEEYDALIANNT